MSKEWEGLNERQQKYMKIIFEFDQMQECNEKLRADMDKYSLPADQWRWIEYADQYVGHTRFKQRFVIEDLVDHGTGSTFDALENRGLILVKYDVSLYVRLTTKGRRMMRQALNISTRVTQPVGTLREWHWRALAHAYMCGDQGVHGWPKGIGSSTIRRLREYQVKGQDCPLVEWVEVSCEPYEYQNMYGRTVSASTRNELRITAFGIQYYQENYQRYTEMYPKVNAQKPKRIKRGKS